MRIEVLEYIIKVAECNSISLAAQNLFIQQTSLSASIKSVEDELGYNIFKRNHKGVRLTREGEQFLVLAQQLLATYQKMKNIKKQGKYTVEIMVHDFLYIFISTALFPGIQKTFPELSLKLLPISTIEEQQKYLNQQEHNVDFKIGIFPEWSKIDTNKFDCIPLLETHPFLYVNAADLNFKQRTEIDLSELEDYRFIQSPYFDHSLFKNMFKEFEGNTTIIMNPLLSLRKSAADAAFTIAPEKELISTLPDLQNQSLIPLKITNSCLSDKKFTFSLICKKALQQTAAPLMDYIITYFKDISFPSCPSTPP